MAKSRQEINDESNARRGVVNKSFKLHQNTVDLVKQLSEDTGKSQAQLVTEALALYAEQLKKPD